MRIKCTYHYGNTRHEKIIPFAEFLKLMQDAIAEMPGNDGRVKAVFDCLHGLMIDGRGEFGWDTYTLEDN